MASTRDITRRIKSVGNTRKITKAMELVAAAKMRKAVDAALATRSYANLSWLTVLNLAQLAKQNTQLHELLRQRPKVNRVAIVLITSNRGLCGGFNSNLLNKVVQSMALHSEVQTDFILLGKKGEAIYRRYGYTVAADFAKEDVITDEAALRPVSKVILQDFLSGKYDKVMVAYTDFVSSLRQVPRLRQLLPVDITLDPKHQGIGIIGSEDNVGMSEEIIAAKQQKHFANHEYIFEPTPQQVLDELVPRLIGVQLYQAVLESNASEQSARMLAMRNASDAADDMVSELTLFYNKARQAGITSEIAEIAGGAAALAQ